MSKILPEARSLGKTGATVSPLGMGTNRWSKGTNDETVFRTYQAALDAGISLIDTAEIYGFGKSESLIGDCIRRDTRPVTVASKFMPFFARSSSRSMLKALDATLARLGLDALDLYYVHFPIPPYRLDSLADGLVEAVGSGRVKQVGVSNFNARQLRRTAERLAKSGISLAANEVHYSLFHRDAEFNGVLDACRELDIALVAYYPLASGRLTSGRGSDRGSGSGVSEVLEDITARRGVSPGQVALNWLLARDGHIIPIPGTTNPDHARDNAEAMSWSLSDEEFDRLDAASRE